MEINENNFKVNQNQVAPKFNNIMIYNAINLAKRNNIINEIALEAESAIPIQHNRT